MYPYAGEDRPKQQPYPLREDVEPVRLLLRVSGEELRRVRVPRDRLIAPPPARLECRPVHGQIVTRRDHCEQAGEDDQHHQRNVPHDPGTRRGFPFSCASDGRPRSKSTSASAATPSPAVRSRSLRRHARSLSSSISSFSGLSFGMVGSLVVDCHRALFRAMGRLPLRHPLSGRGAWRVECGSQGPRTVRKVAHGEVGVCGSYGQNGQNGCGRASERTVTGGGANRRYQRH
jgi:hypothetical protein